MQLGGHDTKGLARRTPPGTLRWDRDRVLPLAPFATVVALCVLYRQIYAIAAIDAIELPLPREAWVATDFAAKVADLGARITWGIAVLAYSVALVAAFGVCIHILLEVSNPTARRLFLVGALVAASLGVRIGLQGNPLTLPQLVDALEEAFLRTSLEEGPFLLHLFNGLAIGTVVMLTFGATAILVERSRSVNDLKRLARRLRHILYAGAAVLIAGSAQTVAMHRLPVAHLVEPWSAGLESLAQLAAVAAGTLWTLFLAALYLPSSFILRARSERASEEALPEGHDHERLRWLSDHGLDLSPLQQVKHVGVVLAPLLTSLPLTGLFELLSGG